MNTKLLLLTLCFLFAGVNLTFGQGADIDSKDNYSQSGFTQSEARKSILPDLSKVNFLRRNTSNKSGTNKGSRATWDVQFNYNVGIAGGGGQAGVETDGSFIYTAKWSNDTICKYSMNGSFIEKFVIPGVSGLRDLAFDGTYFYGGATTATIYKMDFSTHSLIGTINCPTGTKVRHIAYDSDNDAFWVGDWATDILLVSRTGITLNTIPASSHGLTSMYGSAYDNWSPGGPFLWFFCQSGNKCDIVQLNIASKQTTGLQHDATFDFGYWVTTPLAGGLFTQPDIISGSVTLGGLVQSGTNCLVLGYNLTNLFYMNDVSVSVLMSPTSGVSNTNHETIKVEIRNEGMNPQSGFPVTYIINGGTPISETVPATINGFSSYTFSFSQQADLSSLGEYEFTIFSSLPGDESLNNDTLHVSVHSMPQNEPPVIESTFLPVAGTSLRCVSDTIIGDLPVPSEGSHQYWDYSDKFNHIADSFIFAVNYPSFYPHSQNFPNANIGGFQEHNSYSIFNGYYFWLVDTSGLYTLGSWLTSYDTTATYTDPELVVPAQMYYPMEVFDTTCGYGFPVYSGFQVKIGFHEYRNSKSVGYGTLKTKCGCFNDVLQVKTTGTYIDSTWVDFTGTGNFVFYSREAGNIQPFYRFFRNNTFASNYLMMLTCSDSSCNQINDGYFVLPVDIGTITGTVRDSLGAPVTNGKMLLYREHSNFRKNDILATTPIHTDGTYRFDSIPYGVYRIAARPDTIIYPTALTTFYGNVDNWLTCDTVVTDGDTSGIDITLRYHPEQAGLTTLSGNVMYNLIYNSTSGLKAIGSGRPVKDVDVTVKKKTSKAEEIVAQIQTDTSGNYQISGLENGLYEVLVGMPGLHMFSTHELEINNTQILTDFNYYVSLDSIYAVGANSSFIIENEIPDSPFAIYPNPCSDGFFLVINQEWEEEISVRISDALGRIMSENMITTNHRAPSFISTYELPAGLYIIECITGDKHFTNKLVVKRKD